MDETWAHEWIESFSSAWRDGDTEVYVELFTEDAVCLFDPYGPAVIGRDALREHCRATVMPNPVQELRWGKVLVIGSHVAAEWWATMKHQGKDVTLPGAAIMHFGGGGRCDRLRWYPVVQDGVHEPPAEWQEATS